MLGELTEYFQVRKQLYSNNAAGLEDELTVDTGIDSESCHRLLEWFSVTTAELFQVASHF